jgi:hypothetical protein
MKANDVALLTRFKNHERLSPKERETCWLIVSQFVGTTARKHYQSVQRRGYRFKIGGVQQVISNPLKCRVVDDKAYDKTLTRITLFYEFLLDTSLKDKGVPWVLFVYRCRFSLLEFILDAKLNGLGIIPDASVLQLITDTDVKRITECQALLRKYDFEPTDLSGLYELFKECTTKREKTIVTYLTTYARYIQARFPHNYPETFGVYQDEDT